MLLLAGAFELVPLLAVLVLAALVGVPATVGLGGVAGVVGSPALAVALMLALAAGLGAAAERAVRIRRRRWAPQWTARLEALGSSRAVPLAQTGGKARLLADLVELGVPVPDAVVLTSEFVDRIRAALTGGKGLEHVWAALPAPARRDLESFLAASKGKLIVRASFLDGAAEHSFVGVFPAVRDVPPGERERIVEAVLKVLASADDPVAREYRKRRGAARPAARAVLIQRQVDGDVTGAVSSRGPGGRADLVTVDFAKRRSPTRSYGYDLVDGRARALVGEELPETPAWMHRLAVLAVTLERHFGGPVVLEFALEEAQPYVLDVRRAPATERKTWVHAAPLDAAAERHPTFEQELRGGAELAREVLAGVLARAGDPGGVQADEVRFADGLLYYDAEVLRRALATLGSDVLLRGGALVTARASAAVPHRDIPPVPTFAEVDAEAWGTLRKWQREYLLPAARIRAELVAREWLVSTLRLLTDGSGAPEDERRGHPAIRFVLARRVREAAEEATRQRELLEKAEAELGQAVARLLARGAAAWGAMFKGDRHLHATLEEIDRFHADPPGRDALEAEWKGRRVAFDRRRDEPVATRVHRPALPGPVTPAPAVLAGAPVAPGVAEGPAVLLGATERSAGYSAVLLLQDGRSEYCPFVYDANAVVLLSGGVLSPVAVLAGELGLPVVVAPGARALVTRDVRVDGTAGSVEVLP